MGSAVADQATVTGGCHPTGTVTFNLYGNASAPARRCSPTPRRSPAAPPPAPATPSIATGTDYWVGYLQRRQPQQPGHLRLRRRAGHRHPGQPEPDHQPTPSGPAAVGTTVTDTANLTGGDSPTGTITFNLYGPSAVADCSTAPGGHREGHRQWQRPLHHTDRGRPCPGGHLLVDRQLQRRRQQQRRPRPVAATSR